MIKIYSNNRKDDIEKEGVDIGDVNHSHIGDECKDLIDNIFQFKLMNEDLHPAELDNRKLA